MSSIMESDTVADAVRKDYRTARVFKKHHIDFCCGGQKTLARVCEERKLDVEALSLELAEATTASSEAAPDYDAWALDELIEHIEQKHHRYVEETIPLLKQYLTKLVKVHGHAAPYLSQVADLFMDSAGNLAAHMKKEELVLFPFIQRMVNAERNGDQIGMPGFGTVEHPIAMMMAEHDTEGEHFRQIEALTDGFTYPDWACNTFVVAMNLLKEFQDDLHTHIHLENNILFPKAVALEGKLMGSNSTSTHVHESH